MDGIEREVHELMIQNLGVFEVEGKTSWGHLWLYGGWTRPRPRAVVIEKLINIGRGGAQRGTSGSDEAPMQWDRVPRKCQGLQRLSGNGNPRGQAAADPTESQGGIRVTSV